MKTYTKKLSELKPLQNNPNKGSERGNYMLDQSLDQGGIGRSIVIADNDEILGGNHVFEKVGAQDIDRDVIVIETDGNQLVAVKRKDLPDSRDPRAQALIIGDNRAADFHEYDTDVLKALANTNPQLMAEFWYEDELKALLEPDGKAAKGSDDPPLDQADELQQLWQVQPGDIYEIPSQTAGGQFHRVMCGDSTNADHVQALMNGRLARLVVTDPPYGVSYADKNKFLNSIEKGNCIQTPIENDHATKEQTQAMWKAAFHEMNAVMDAGAVVYCFMPQGGDQMMMMMMMMMMGAGIEPRHELIWLKNNHVLGRADYAYKHEPILYAWKEGGHKFYGDFQTSIIEVDRPSKSKLHPTMKPVELITRLIKNSSRREELVYDLFIGSGTTIVACEETGRLGYGMEIWPPYVAVTLERLIGLGLEPRKIQPHKGE